MATCCFCAVGLDAPTRTYAVEKEPTGRAKWAPPAWITCRVIERLPRLRGRNKHRVSHRHIIDWLVRKPGAFEQYRYREDLFPTSRFRMAYDSLQQTHGDRAARGVPEDSVHGRSRDGGRRG